MARLKPPSMVAVMGIALGTRHRLRVCAPHMYAGFEVSYALFYQSVCLVGIQTALAHVERQD